jgi:hypothetical protein
MGVDVSDEYLSTSEHEDVIGSLEHLVLCLDSAATTKQAWKWVALSLFSAVQGSMVCHLQGPAELEVLKHENMLEVLAWLKDPARNPEPKKAPFLASPDELYMRLRGKDSRIQPHGGPISTSTEQDNKFKRLVDLRNELIHFTPKGWSIEIALIVKFLSPMIDLIETIDRMGYAFRHCEPGIVPDLLAEVRKRISRVDLHSAHPA